MIDPYFVLELSHLSTEAEIRSAFHRKLADVSNKDEVIDAYGMICNSVERNRVRFDRIDTCLFDLNMTDGKQVDVVALIKELAFLSPWEMTDA